jgi:probable HAF family extracellular repeat protein
MHRTFNTLRLFIAAAALLLAVLAAPAAQAGSPSYSILPFVPSAISADGSTVVGSGGVRWTAATGPVAMPPPVGYSEWSPTAVSADGSVVVGNVITKTFWSGLDSLTYYSPVRWTQATGSVILPMPGGYETSYATGVSADGSVVVGTAGDKATRGERPEFTEYTAWRWDAGPGAIQKLPPLKANHYTRSFAGAVSGDGSTVAGASMPAYFSTVTQWCLWRGTKAATSMGPAFDQYAYFPTPHAVSYDGAVAAGAGPSAYLGLSHAFRWTAAGGMVSLGALPGHLESDAFAMSADGSVVVGYSDLFDPGRDYHAFVWDPAHGMRDLGAVLAGLGVDLGGSTLEIAVGISGDGRTIVGYGHSASGAVQGWIAHL